MSGARTGVTPAWGTQGVLRTGMSSAKRGSVSRCGVRLRGEGSGTATSISGKEGKVVVTE